MNIKRLTCFFLFTVMLISNALVAPVGAESQPNHITVAQPSTNVLGGMVAVQKIDSEADLSLLLSVDVKPAAALLSVREDMSIIGTDGTVLTTISAFLSDTDFKIIPALNVKDSATADNLVGFLDSISFYDVILISTDADLLRDLRSRLPLAYAAIDFTEALRDTTELTKELCLSIRKTVWESGASIAFLPSHLRDTEMLQYLYHRQVTVWLDAESVDPYEALFSGAVGLVSDNPATLLSIACNEFPERTMTRSPLIIGHRGITLAPENTIEGARLAFASGAGSVELDIMLTADGEIVVSHDDWTGRTCNENLFIPETPLAQLKELYVNQGYENHADFSKCRIPTLLEFLEAFQNTDCQLTVEIKTGDPAIVPKMCQLIRDTDMVGQCNVICFFPEQIAAVNAIAPEIPIGYLCDDPLSYTNIDDSIRQLRELIGPINATFNPGGELASAKTFLLHCRGIGSHIWTVSGKASSFGKPFATGTASITADTSNAIADKPTKATLASPFPAVFRVGDTYTPEFLLRNFDHSASSDPDDIICTVFGDADAITTADKSITFQKPGTYTFLISVSTRLGFLSYQLPAALPITVTVEGDAATTPPTDTAAGTATETQKLLNNSTDSIPAGVAIGTFAVVAVAAVVIIVRKKKD